ncbi:MAG: cytochrome d ubiquinol oxidase subunit II [Calditrichota bacterium]
MNLDLNTVWFLLVVALLAGYAVLDGFDLGVGALHLFARKDEHRRALIKAIGPVWDGNEVWLVVGGGALFAAFPEVYATAFSGFYTAFILLLFALIFRAVSIEFRNQRESGVWRRGWDVGFSLGSIAAALLAGVALGNIACGIPLNEQHEFTGNFLTLLRPYPLLVGLTGLALFALHGALYITLKTEGELQSQARGWAKKASIIFVLGYILMVLATMKYARPMIHPFVRHPWLFIVPLITVLALYNILKGIKLRQDYRAFRASCVMIIALMIRFGIGMFPQLILSKPNIANSLDIYNAASSTKTLKTMLIIALIGMPLVIAYTVWIYRVFRGKVDADADVDADAEGKEGGY